MTSRCLFVPSLPLEEWPEVDRELWARATEGDSYAEGGEGEAAHWRPATRNLVQQNYGVWLAWLRREGRLAPVADPSVRASKANLRDFLAAMRACGYAGRSSATRLRAVGSALGVMWPQFDPRWIGRAAGRVEAGAKRARDVRSRRFAPEDLLAYADGLMTACEGASNLDVALSFRDGLLLAFQTSRALRIANLGSVRIDKHLRRRGADYFIQFGAEEMKGGRAFGFPWPPELVAKLEAYLRVHRAILSRQRNGADGESALWLGRDGTPLKQDSVASIVRRHTDRALGRGSGPHLMRHVLATTLAEHAPQDIAHIASALGHTSLETSHRSYVHANAVRAGYLLHEAQAARLKDH